MAQALHQALMLVLQQRGLQKLYKNLHFFQKNTAYFISLKYQITHHHLVVCTLQISKPFPNRKSHWSSVAY